MKITIDANPVVQEILKEELLNEIKATLPKDEFSAGIVDGGASSEKGFLEDFSIALLSELAAELFGKILQKFSKKHKVKISIQEADGRKIDVSYCGEDFSKLEQFLVQCVK